MVHSNHESHVGGLAMWYLGSSAARFHLLSFKRKKRALYLETIFTVTINSVLTVIFIYVLSAKRITAFWIVRKYFFGTYDGNGRFSPVLSKHRLADEVMWEKFILPANKNRQVKADAFF